MPPPVINAVIERIIEEAPLIRTFRIRFPDATPFEFTPGQFAMVSVPSVPGLTRAYSIASSPLDKGYIELTMNKVGKFTTVMFDQKEGAPITVRGPLGKWLYDEKEPVTAFVCGGTGITPFRCFARYVRQKGLSNRIHLFASVKLPHEFAYKQELKELNSTSQFKTYLTVTRPNEMAPGEAWDGPTGRLSLEVVQKHLPEWKEAVHYLCGPNALIDAYKKACAEAGIPSDRVRAEKWGDF